MEGRLPGWVVREYTAIRPRHMLGGEHTVLMTFVLCLWPGVCNACLLLVVGR